MATAIAGSVAFVVCSGMFVWFLLHRRSIKAIVHKLDVFDPDPLEDEAFDEGTGRDDSSIVIWQLQPTSSPMRKSSGKEDSDRYTKAT